MLNTIEKISMHARELALQHQVRAGGVKAGHIKKQFHADIASLRTFVDLLENGSVCCGQQAEEWLLDNAEFIEEQALDVELLLTTGTIAHLPRIKNRKSSRIQVLCEAYLDQVEGILDETSFAAYLNAYQEISVLTLAETRSIPLMIRVALISRIAETMALVRDRREVCTEVQQLLKRLEGSKLSAEVVGNALTEAGQDVPLSGAWAAHLISHLREWSGDTAAVREWLLCKYENGLSDLDRVVTYEVNLQAIYQVRAGNLITSLRKNERRDWEALFEQISFLDQTMRRDHTGMYANLDVTSRNELLNRIERLARCMRVPESLVASQSLTLAKEASNRHVGSEQPRQAFLAYYLLEPAGNSLLFQSLKSCSRPRRMPGEKFAKRPRLGYFASLLALFALFWIALAAWIGYRQNLTMAGLSVVLLGLLFPVSEWVMTGLHFGIERICRPKLLLRYDFSHGVMPEAATMVIIPAIWSSADEVEELADRLERHHLANRDRNIHFALLGDFTDAKQERLPMDENLIAVGLKRIDQLNQKYGNGTETTFHFYHRRRQWNPAEGVYMGWERKRGKLVEFVELLRGRSDTSYEVTHGDRTVLAKIKYILTLDADTQLPLGSAQRLIGILHLPYNRPRLNEAKTRVVEGYGVLQPRVSISHDSSRRSRLAYYCSNPGIDPYAFAASDPYQDALGEGIFTGKGIFDVNVFAELLAERIPSNSVLSHDLLEGGFLRGALVSDVELIEDLPSTFVSFQKRMHRWIRGDWQLLCWLRPKLCDRRGELKPIDLSLLTRWQILDNLRRSLVPAAAFILLLLTMTVLPGSAARWLVLLFATMLIPLLRQLLTMDLADPQPKLIRSTLVMIGFGFLTLPFQTAVVLDAVLKTLYRMGYSKRRLLEWTSSFHTERNQGKTRSQTMLGTGIGYGLIALFAAGVALQTSSGLRGLGFALCLLWALAPLAAAWLDQPVAEDKMTLDHAATNQLRVLAKQIWQFFEDYTGSTDHFLPPDNVQIEPPNGVAHRTSPTNIGLLLTSTLAARELDFITTPSMVERLDQTITMIEKLDKWNGHLYNWYDTLTLGLLRPAYVSTVDSGNFVASLMTVKQGLLHWLQAEDRGFELIDRLERLIRSTDFRPLYDYKAKLFVLGYHAESDQRDTILYDLLASEARQTSFVAIALGQIPVSHWMAIGRTAKKQGGQVTLISWTGTMFEYMMPWLIMRTYPGTVWDSTYRGIVNRQMEYAQDHGVPFGISESGYYAFDYQMNYQYRAFGVPGLGFKRGLDQDLVVAPYAAIMALPYALHEGLRNLDRMEQLGARGQYGFYEAIDYTASRMPQGESCKVIQSFMAHHQGMSLMTLANLLVPSCMINYFHSDERVQAAELLLIERVPPKSAILKRDLPGKKRNADVPKSEQNVPLREIAEVPSLLPKVNMLGNGSLSSLVTDSGSGFLRVNGYDLTRWREDPIQDPWGSFMYIRDVAADLVWSPCYQPCRTIPDYQGVQFMQERTTFLREEAGLRTRLDITVAADCNAEIRRLTLMNTGKDVRIIEVSTFMELAMVVHEADKAHPAFTKLFIQTEFAAEAQCLLARKRPRHEGEPTLWAFHRFDGKLAEPSSLEYETDRARFIGRGYPLSRPRGLDARLGGTLGSVADPAFIMRRRVSIKPGEEISLTAISGAAESREMALEIATNLSQEQQVERSFRMAWTRSQIDLQHLRISLQDAAVYQLLAGRILFTAPLRPEQAESIVANVKGQPGLWAHGVSGDRPIILVRIAETVYLPFLIKVFIGYAFLREKGLLFDLVVWNESLGGYQEELRDAILRTIEQYVPNRGGGAGVHIVAAASQSVEDKRVLFAVARLLLHADGPSLRAQLETAEPRPAAEKADLVPIAPATRYPSNSATEEKDVLFFNGYGGFSPDGSEYRIVLKGGNPLPAPWINVLANANFGSLVSELFTGHTWWRNSRECKLTPWSNDPALDPPGEACYIRDEESGEYWGMAPSRKTHEPSSVYRVAHGQGYSRFEHERIGLRQEATVFVPTDDPVKIIRVRLKNLTGDHRRLSLTYYAEWVLGVHREGNTAHVLTEWEEEHGLLLARNTFQDAFREATAFLAVNPPSNGTRQSWTCSRLAFIGRDGDMDHPAAMRKEQLSGETGSVYDACGAVQTTVELEPGEEKDVYFLLGCTDSWESVTQLAHKYREAGACEQALEEVTAFWRGLNGTIKVSTPSPEMDILLNNWLLYQTVGCRLWARSGFYQAGGAFGFRDQLQDSLALLHSRSDWTRAQILLHASHQYLEGDVQHWWHEETHRGIRTKFSDDLLWLPYAVVRYLEDTEDESLLAEIVPFLQSAPLSEDEHERYEETVYSEETGTILEHCLRAIDRSLRLGEHGLPLMGIGDWNDGMSNIGPKGRGESVWLGWFLGDVLRGIAPICDRFGERDRAVRYRQTRLELEQAMQDAGWDGKWYRRAFTDSGDWLGSIRNAECRIDAIAQSWSVISGMAPPERAQQAMLSFDRELVDRSLAVAHILDPPFDTTQPSPGYIQAYPPGIRENGGQYTHGVIWSIAAWSLLGDGNKAFELFHMFNPINHTKSSTEARIYAGEPYVIPADVYTEPPHRGHAGWTWYTGSSGWMYQAGIEWIVGLKRRGEQLIIKPCFPAEWPAVNVAYTFKSTVYHIQINNPSRKTSGVETLRIDGQAVDLEDYTRAEGSFIPLIDDHGIHQIELTM